MNGNSRPFPGKPASLPRSQKLGKLFLLPLPYPSPKVRFHIDLQCKICKFDSNMGKAPTQLRTKFKFCSRSQSFPGIPAYYSRSQIWERKIHSRSLLLGMRFLIPVPIPKSWGCNFSFPFPLPNFGNGLSYSRSHSQNPKSHSRSPKCCQKMSKVGKMPKITISCISSWKLH